MRDDANAASRKPAMAKTRPSVRISPAVHRRLRLLAIAEDTSIERVLSDVLDSALPAAAELATRLAADIAAEAMAS